MKQGQQISKLCIYDKKDRYDLYMQQNVYHNGSLKENLAWPPKLNRDKLNANEK